jgi:asparagine synthase (glutamine-hydrolysing)
MDTDTVYEWLRRSACGNPLFWGSADAMKDVSKKQLLSSRIREASGKRTSWDAIEPIQSRFLKKAWDKSGLNWMSYVDLSMRLPELLLMRVDKMSMGVSLEARVPFLDHKFVELAMSIPSEMKLRGHTTKYLLKRAVRGVIPDEVIDRPKQPFNVPIMEWFFDRLGVRVRESIEDFARNTDLAMWWRTFIANPIPGSEVA